MGNSSGIATLEEAVAVILSKIEKVDGPLNSRCWQFPSPLDKAGYGKKWFNGAGCLTHRLVYEHYRGDIPDGLHLDHLCRNRACCNPDHLEPVTLQENVRRGLNGVLRTHCESGLHEWVPENQVTFKLTPVCRPCKNAATRAAWRAKNPKVIRTHCGKGHEYTMENTYLWRDRRRCRACDSDRDKRRIRNR